MTQWIYRKQENKPKWGPAGVPVAVLNILAQRGVSSEEEASDFLATAPKTTHDPSLLKDLEEAVTAIIAAADRGDRICIYGDYDADGVTSTALLYSVIKRLTDRVDFYVPSRFTDGYGLNSAAIDRIAAKGTGLLISVDCGSTNAAEVEHAKSLGLGVIITDHHELDESNIPKCLFVNPKRRDSEYPFRSLSGCGVAFKIAQGIQRRLTAKGDTRFTRTDLNQLLDLVAISTIADVVPLLDENRSLVKYGLRKLNERKRPGLRILLDMLDLSDKTIDAESVGFILAPHINSLGRMETAEAGVTLLASLAPEEELISCARRMVDCNLRRRTVQDDTKDICLSELEHSECGDRFKIIRAPGAHEGVAGIVAGGLKETLHLPICIVTPTEEGVLKGTGRCIPGLDLHQILSECGDIFLRFGGHAGACGFSIKEEMLPLFRSRAEEALQKRLEENPDLLEEKIYIEKNLEPEEKTIAFAESLTLLEPYGEANPKPVFAIENCRIKNLSRMGSEGQHARFIASCGGGRDVPCVLFRRAEDFAGLLESASPVDVAGELGINEFNGSRKLQLTVKDIRGRK